jgi:hypothetical protein
MNLKLDAADAACVAKDFDALEEACRRIRAFRAARV